MSYFLPSQQRPPRRSTFIAPSCPTIPRPAARVQSQRSQHSPSPWAALLRRVWSKLAFETHLEEGIHILCALHNGRLLMVIGQDEEALLLDRLDDNLSDLVGGHQHTVEHG